MHWLTADILQSLSQGLLFTISLTAVTSIISVMLGVGIGTLRLSVHPGINRLAAIYVDVFRNIPALVLIIFLAFAVPNVFPAELRQRLFFNNLVVDWGKGLLGFSLPFYVLAAAAGLTLNTSAYLAELFRAGVGTLPQEYVDAARSFGATKTIVFWQILLPQGFRAAFPAIATRLVHNMKNTALASFVAVPDFFQATQAVITRTFRATELLLLAAIVYLFLAVLFAALLRVIERLLEGNLKQEPAS